MKPEPVLRLEGVIKEYGEEVVTRVLHGIDLTLEQGEFAALIGPSGSGKSTLLNIIGLLDRPTSGRVLLQGQDTRGLDEDSLARLRARTLGFIFQFHHLMPAFTALENVMMPALAERGWPDERMRTRALELLAQVGLKERAGAHPGQLSGGQQQRVAIARALVMSPALVLADEPTGNLDTGTSAQVFELLRHINREQRMTFLIVTHDPRMAQRCDRIIEVVDGRIVSDRREPPHSG
ncbi:ABC transporter ATP-binding protein [Archangium gephyra]|uniref:ABC transporter ATP-binding protein n=1 Tax=Archangium gephyra TaxID=48 RepID=UPI0035D4D8F6